MQGDTSDSFLNMLEQNVLEISKRYSLQDEIDSDVPFPKYFSIDEDSSLHPQSSFLEPVVAEVNQKTKILDNLFHTNSLQDNELLDYIHQLSVGKDYDTSVRDAFKSQIENKSFLKTPKKVVSPLRPTSSVIKSQTPSRSPVAMSSSQVIKNVLTQFESPEKKLSTPEIVKNSPSVEVALTVKSVPTDNPAQLILENLKQLNNSNPVISAEAIKIIYSTMKENRFLEGVYGIVIEEISKKLEAYKDCNDSFLQWMLQILILMKEASAKAARQVIAILRDASRASQHESIVQTLLAMGPKGLSALIDVCAEATSEWDSFILTHIANHPFIQEAVIVPALLRECNSGDFKKKVSCVLALTKLGFRARGALSVLVELLESGTIDRLTIVRGIKGCGEEGEKLLLFYMNNHPNPRIRAVCAYACGIRVSTSPTIRIIILPNFASAYSATSKIVVNQNFLQFDARELVSAIRRGIIDEGYDELARENYEISSENTALLAKIIKEEKLLVDEDFSELFTDSEKPEKEEQKETQKTDCSSEAISALCTALFDTEEPVRIAAAKSLGNIDSRIAETALNSLCQVVRSGTNKIKAEAMLTLSKMSDGIEDPMKIILVVKIVLPSLKDQFWNVRYAAVRCLRFFGNRFSHDKTLTKSVLVSLEKILKDGSVGRPEVAETILYMGQVGISALIDILKQGSANSSQVRMACVHALSLTSIDSPMIDRVIETLFASANDKVSSCRKSALISLATLSHKAQENLSYLRTKAFIPFLYNFLKDKEKIVRDIASQILASLGPHGEFVMIEAVLKDSNPLIRASATYGLQLIGSKTIRTLLLALIHENDPLVARGLATAVISQPIQNILEVMKERPAAQRKSTIDLAREIVENQNLINLHIHLNSHLLALIREMWKVIEQE